MTRLMSAALVAASALLLSTALAHANGPSFEIGKFGFLPSFEKRGLTFEPKKEPIRPGQSRDGGDAGNDDIKDPIVITPRDGDWLVETATPDFDFEVNEEKWDGDEPDFEVETSEQNWQSEHGEQDWHEDSASPGAVDPDDPWKVAKATPVTPKFSLSSSEQQWRVDTASPGGIALPKGPVSTPVLKLKP